MPAWATPGGTGKKIAIAIFAMATALALAPAALADPITGSINVGEAFGSSDTWNSMGIIFNGLGQVKQANGT